MPGLKTRRTYHLIIGIAVIAAYLLGEGEGVAHAWVGYGVAALLGLRLLIGFVPRTAFALRRLVPSFSRAPLGQTGMRHPAISRSLVLAILLTTAGAAITGILMDRGRTLTGQSVREETSLLQLIPPAYADEDGDEEDSEREEDREGDEEGPLGELHELFGNLILPLVGLHIAYLLLFRFDLARFMLFMPARRRPR